MSRWNKAKVAFAAAGLSGGLALAVLPVAFAETGSSTAPADQGGGVMQHGMPSAQGRMMHGMMDRMSGGKTRVEMTQMMYDCNRMMAAGNPDKDGPAAPSNEG